MKRFWLPLVVVAALTLACAPAAGPGPGPGADGQPKTGGTLNIRATLDPFNWDVHIQRTIPNIWGVATAYSSLLDWKMGPEMEYTEMVLQPGLAERWEVSPDARSFTFHLRKGVKFQDLPPVHGRELTSADVKFSAEYGGATGEFKGARPGDQAFFFEGLERIDTPDKYTAAFHFKDPYVPFISYAASDYFPILAREIYDQDRNFQDRIVGTGPLMLDSEASQKGTRWVWKRHPDYYEAGKPYLDGIRWLVLPQEAAAFAGFQVKQLDILHQGVDVQDAQQIAKSNPEAVSQRYLEHAGIEIYMSQLPARNSPVRDVRVRRAISLAIDRDEINRVLFGGEAQWSLPGARPGLFTEAEAKQLYRHDPAEARRLVTEAGYPGGLTLEWPVPNDEDRATVSMIELIQAQARRAGIDIQIKVMERTDQRRNRRAYQFDLDQGGTGGPADDPDVRVWTRYHSTHHLNYSYVRDPELDRLVVTSRGERDVEKRKEVLRAITRHVVEHTYYIDLLYRPRWGFWHPYVHNYRPHLGSRVDYAFAWLDK